MKEKSAGEDPSKSLKRLEEESKHLKEKIKQAKRAQNMPLDSKLGDPTWEAKAADGRFDRPEDDD